MNGDSTDLLRILIGGGFGGGLIGVLTIIYKGWKEWRDGRLAKEDTAIKRWRELAAEYRGESENKSLVIAAYRLWYPRVWAAYVQATGDRDTYPTDPTQPEENR